MFKYACGPFNMNSAHALFNANSVWNTIVLCQLNKKEDMALNKCASAIVIFISCSCVSLLPVPAVNNDVKMKCYVVHIDDILKNNCTYIGFNPKKRDENQTKGECKLKKNVGV